MKAWKLKCQACGLLRHANSNRQPLAYLNYELAMAVAKNHAMIYDHRVDILETSGFQ